LSFHISVRDPSGAPPAVAYDAPPWWVAALALLAALVLQTLLPPWLSLRGAAPGFVLLFVLWYGFRTSFAAGLLAGTVAGACEDALAGWTGAAWTLSTAAAGALAGRCAGSPISEAPLRLAAFAGLATLARYGLFAAVLGLEGRALALPEAHLHAAAWQSALDAVLAWLALTVFPRLGVSRVGLR
jgi:rod shape-determining protein MreD